jgi:multicomponent Na+:H+ antiporter subunit D
MVREPFPLSIDWGTILGLPPALIFFAGALLMVLIRGRYQDSARKVVMLLTPLVGLWNLTSLVPGEAWEYVIFDLDLSLVRVDRLSLLFGLLFHVGAFLGVIYALRVKDPVQQVAALAYAGSALGAVFAGDYLTLFFFWEAMAVSSAFLVWAGDGKDAAAAGMRYLVIHVASGLMLLAGAMLHLTRTGGLSFDYVGLTGVEGWLIFLAFGVKAGFPFLHNWITDAYPESSPTGTVFLSMFTTKVAIYALARGFPGTELLIYIGAAMALFPIFFAVIENDLRRVLGYSMINQIGFMVVGIGIGTELALNGAVAHAFNEVLFKGLLFMTMGAVLLRTGTAKGSELGGLYKTMPKTAILCMVGAASISAFPLFSGFVSKAMVMAALLEDGHTWIWFGLLFASAGVFHHAGIKIPFFAFFAHDSGIRTTEPPGNMMLAMVLAAIGCIFLGSFPVYLYSLLPWTVEYTPYTYSHVMLQTQLLMFSALAFIWLKLSGIYPPELKSVNIDVEWLYRWAGPRAAKVVMNNVIFLVTNFSKSMREMTAPVIDRLIKPNGSLARILPTGATILWTAAILAGFLTLYLLRGAS